ncbi:hypothetical protein ACHAWX_005008 [Stephanocyclus meneghinianus]
MKKYGAVQEWDISHDVANDSEDDDTSVPTITRNDSGGRFAPTWARGIVVLSAILLVLALSPNCHSASSGDSIVASTLTILGMADDNPYDNDHDVNEPLFYDDQLVNHFSKDPDASVATWSNRYYKSTKYFKGPGSPIFIIIGGEGALDHGMLYPFITEHLAPRFSAAVIEIEHRFYGPYQPIMGREATVQELLELLTPQQAMADMIRLTKHFKDELDCLDYDRKSELYCPVITVGGSYPGFLSAMFRLVYPDFVDIAYASSAPLKLYDQSTDQDVYYDIVTQAAEHASKGCARAVRETLEDASKLIMHAKSVEDAVKSMNMCVDSIPEYIDNVKTLKDDVMMAVGFSFADYDMDAYPPGKDLGLYKACQVFQHKNHEPLEKMAKFFELVGLDAEFEEEYPSLVGEEAIPCFDLSIFLPDGENARITTSDWSGSGGGNDGKMWDFQLCTTVIDPIGFSSESMFPKRKWTYAALTDYCQKRYGKDVVPQPRALVEDMGFDDLVGNGASRILFTNGLQDMWSGGSYLENVSDSILALNFENGAHHSDLSHVGPSDKDTDDIRLGFVQITNILAKWLDEIKAESE